MKRVLVTGSRDWTDHVRFEKVMDALVAEFNLPLTLVHGHNPRGADAMAERWYVKHSRHTDLLLVERHPATWRTAGRYDPTAGFRRNIAMVNLGADVCVAFIKPCEKRGCIRKPPLHGSHGTVHCSTEARKARIPTRIYKEGYT